MNTHLPKNFFPFLWFFLKNYKFCVVFACILAFCAGFWGPFNSMLVKHIINLLPQVNKSNTSTLIIPSTLVVINFIVFDNFTWRTIAYIRAKFSPIIASNMISKLTNYCLENSNQFYLNNLSGKLAKQITNLADGFERLANSLVFNFLRGASLLLTGIVFAYSANSIFCFIFISWFFLFSTISILMSKKLVLLADKQANIESTIVGELVDVLSNHSNVRSFSRKIYEILRIQPFLKNQQKAYKNTYFYNLIMNSIQGGLIAIMMAFSMYFLIYFYTKNLITVGDFALVLGISMELGHMMWYTMNEVDEFNKILGKCRQSLLVLIKPIEIKNKPNALPLKCSQGEIIFNKVNFCYNQSDTILKHISAKIVPGEKVGLVGPSGAGKSTFINLILRLYDVNDGSIFVDKQNIKDVTQKSLRENIALIPQDPTLFHRSLMENIRYGRIDATYDEVIKAAQKAHADEFITKLPQGYNTFVGERGVKLSGGQRQRIAIARAILKNAPILILDEATSQLDSVTENLIQESLWNLMQSRTTIVIAHRLSTLLNMDRILVFNEGEIVEEGSHHELIKIGKLYKKLWNAQVGGFLGNG